MSIPTFFRFRSIAEAYEKLVPYVLDNGFEQQSERGLTRYLPYTLIEITNPKIRRVPNKYPLGKKTIDDYISCFLNGYNNQDFVYTYHDRIVQYGCNSNCVNQLKYVIDKLKENKNTRRAYISIWNPCQDTKTNEIPCLVGIHFQIINDNLIMQTIMRSQDLLLAFPSNLLAFSRLGEKVANEVGIPFKHLIHYVMNLHIYVERDKDYIDRWFR